MPLHNKKVLTQLQVMLQQKPPTENEILTHAQPHMTNHSNPVSHVPSCEHAWQQEKEKWSKTLKMRSEMQQKTSWWWKWWKKRCSIQTFQPGWYKWKNRKGQGGEGGGASGEEVLIPTLPCCYLAPSLWTGLVWAGLCCLTGAGRPRTTCL